MPIEITEESSETLAEYATVPIAFEVRRALDAELTERDVDVPYVKDYDAISGEGPSSWAQRFDLSRWGFFAARIDGRRVGGAAVFERDCEAVLWDIRVAPDVRGQGVGRALFRAAETWAAARHCTRLVAETQNINVPACRFYERQGCSLDAVNRLAYPDLPDEIQLLWHKALVT
jgi:GNAT superfamily N-acetyltransferase